MRIRIYMVDTTYSEKFDKLKKLIDFDLYRVIQIWHRSFQKIIGAHLDEPTKKNIFLCF